MVKKIKAWFIATGLQNVGWLGGSAAAFILIGGAFGAFLAGACFGLFVYFNYAVIKELIYSIK